jgi:Ca2+:H+ antiporter
LRAFVRREATLLVSALSALLFSTVGAAWLDDLSNLLWMGATLVWLFTLILASAFAVVRHADRLAARLGEPYGTLILTLSVISIEIVTISSVMVTGADNPELARDSMYSVLMIVLNAMVGLCLLLGALRHLEQQYNLAGANAFWRSSCRCRSWGWSYPTTPMPPTRQISRPSSPCSW